VTSILTTPDADMGAAAETAELEKTDREKAENLRVAEERHRQNVEALNNLQKALVSIKSNVMTGLT